MARVVITGASSGIGRATILEPAARGHEVVATARRPETLGGPIRCPAARSGDSPSSRPSMPRSPPGHSTG
jgi:NAD(P)-dependent dehydrogenase (short-subunit alcohol dehydrogenase family)